ncbi:MAG: hypothetical protein HRU03_09365, partial [Nanoarchaeales archaeon]|nr:hypothetical protein [Nanoarchaeales archaeon]
MYIKKLFILFLFFIGSSQLVFSSSGICASTHYSCDNGDSLDNDGLSPTEWTWTCDSTGSTGGPVSCSEAKPTAPPADCSYGVSHGDSRTMYQSPSVPFGNTCNSQNRVCTDGSLSGGYTNTACVVLSPIADDGICASAVNGRNLYTAPTNFCDSLGGNSIPSFSGNVWNWNCFSGTIGDDISCSANKKINGACNTVTVDQCVDGIFTYLVDNSTHFKWECSGINTGLTDFCALPKDLSVLDSLQVEPNSVWYNSSLVKYGTCKYDSSIG